MWYIHCGVHEIMASSIMLISTLCWHVELIKEGRLCFYILYRNLFRKVTFLNRNTNDTNNQGDRPVRRSRVCRSWIQLLLWCQLYPKTEATIFNYMTNTASGYRCCLSFDYISYLVSQTSWHPKHIQTQPARPILSSLETILQGVLMV